MENIKIERRVDGDVTTFAVEGPVNTNTSPSLQDILIGEFDTAAKGITIDLSKVNYVSSAGLRVLLIAQKKSKSTGIPFHLTGLTDQIKELFNMVGFTEFFKII